MEENASELLSWLYKELKKIIIKLSFFPPKEYIQINGFKAHKKRCWISLVIREMNSGGAAFYPLTLLLPGPSAIRHASES